jgi:orotate phosphoribosyltransferase
MSSAMHDDVIALLPARRGHFLLESGHHGDLWLDLELLCLKPDPVRRLAAHLATRLAPYAIEAVCGPLVEGAFVALMVAAELGVPFSYAERFPNPARSALFPVDYRVRRALRAHVRGKRVGIVNDVINAGSAVRGTLADLEACKARPIAIGTLLVLGSSASRIAADRGVALETLASLPNNIWTPGECPMCARRLPLASGLGPDPFAEPTA